MFGEVAPGGIKFHRQGAKFKQQRRGRIPPDYTRVSFASGAPLPLLAS